jgi:hypothetical protein
VTVRATLDPTDPTALLAWRAAAVDVAVEAAAGMGAEGTFVIAAHRVDADGLVGAAERDTDPVPTDLGTALHGALGAGVLPRTAVAFVGCFTPPCPGPSVAHEVASLVGRCGGVAIVEPALDHPPYDVTTLLANAGVVATGDVTADTAAGPARVVTVAPRPSGPRGPHSLRVFLMDWHGKARAIADALAAGGHRLVGHPADADVAMINNDYPGLGRLPYLDACVDSGGRAYLYPDGAAPTLMAAWDGLYPPYPRLSGVLACAPGHAEVARRYGYPHPVHVVGWGMCDLAPRRAGRPPRRVLLAPEHPPYHGNARPLRQNAEALRGLLDAGAEVTVRTIGEPEESGLPREPGVTYVRGDTGGFAQMIAQIDAHDAVCATSTFGLLAVARGVTTVMWNTGVQYHHETNALPAHMDRYAGFCRYPFDLDDGLRMGELLQAAAADTELVGEWRARFIGDALDPDALTRAIGS